MVHPNLRCNRTMGCTVATNADGGARAGRQNGAFWHMMARFEGVSVSDLQFCKRFPAPARRKVRTRWLPVQSLVAASACKVAAAGLPEVPLLVQPCSWHDENWSFAVPHADIAPHGFSCFSEKPASLGRWSHAK